MTSRRMLRQALLALLVLPGPGWALDYVWLGGVGLWDSNNWDRAGSPGRPDHNVFIDGGNALASTVTLSAGVLINNLAISQGDSLVLPNNSSLILHGSIGNDGEIRPATSTGKNQIYLFNPSTLSGSGVTRLGAHADSSLMGSTLTIAAGHTFAGGGSLLSLGLINRGTLLADAAIGMAIYSSNAAASVDNASGLIRVGNGSFVDFTVSNVSGGILRGEGDARLQGGTLRNMTLEGRLSVVDGGYSTLSGAITNNATLTLSSSGASTYVTLAGATTFAGNGEIVLGGTSSQSNTILLGGSLTLVQHTLRGSGALSLASIINQGKIIAEGPEGLNVALLGAGSAARLSNDEGLIEVADGSSLGVTLGVVGGGTLRSLGLGRVWSGSGGLRDLSLEGAFFVPGDSGLTVGGTITNKGTLTLDDRDLTVSTLNIAGETVLAGSGKLLMPSMQTAWYANSIVRVPGPGPNGLTIGAGHTLQGGGMVHLGYFRNEGTVIVDTPVGLHFLPFDSGQLLGNRGLLRIEPGSTMDLVPNALHSLSMRQDAAGARTEVFGTLELKQLLLEAGVLSGTGMIIGDVSNSGGTISPGASPGKLTVQGNVLLGADSVLEMQIEGEGAGIGYDWLAVTGSLTLGGVLDLRFAPGYTPALGSSFMLLSSGAGTPIAGQFASVFSNGSPVQMSYGVHGVSISLAPVPEPASLALWLGGLLLLLWACRLRSPTTAPPSPPACRR